MEEKANRATESVKERERGPDQRLFNLVCVPGRGCGVDGEVGGFELCDWS